ncbi:cytochrome c oxidase assembly protein [Bacillus sp. PS06]|uniref:cytochrome c oxidase assembly protein n=1 Tax=Bacillus sp. PS06 TaxID=2764176 RepID=UPI00178040A8|nr:cytochrome c oxidase assembly protein [Bacillus sp. PS06]MBD8069026.1 cytochrome c oxidase assembly protein [Bacillus sp. PS06]
MIELLRNFTFHTQWNAGILLMVLLGIVFYLFLLPTSGKHSMWKSIAFISGLFLIFLAVGSPLNLLGRIVFRVHMIQMVIILLIAAPLLLLGFKTEILRRAFTYPKVKKILLIIHHPKLTIPVFHLLFIGYHIPVVFSYVRVSYILHYVYLLCLFVAALLLWSPIVVKLKELDRLAIKQKIVYCFANLVLMIPFSVFLIMSNEILYSIYIDPELIKSSLEVCLPPGQSVESIPEDFFNYLLPYPPLHEQRIGGVIFLLSQAITFGSVALYLKRKGKIKK